MLKVLYYLSERKGEYDVGHLILWSKFLIFLFLLLYIQDRNITTPFSSNHNFLQNIKPSIGKNFQSYPQSSHPYPSYLLSLTLLSLMIKSIIIEFINYSNVSHHRNLRIHQHQNSTHKAATSDYLESIQYRRIASSSEHKHCINLTHDPKQSRKNIARHHQTTNTNNQQKIYPIKEGKLTEYYMIIFWRWFESASVNNKKRIPYFIQSTIKCNDSLEMKGGCLLQALQEKIYYILTTTENLLRQAHPPLASGSKPSTCLLYSPSNISQPIMSIQNCPVLHPTWKEFKNFSQYVEKLDRLYKKNYGMVKDTLLAFFTFFHITQVVPPPEWKPASSAYHARLNGLMVNGPIEQNIFGKGGVYECLHIQKKSLSLKQYKDKMGVFDKITDDLTADEVEEMFWKNIVFSPPLYGADLLSTLMDQKAGPWNLSTLDSILKYAINSNVRGVTTPYCYVGSWKTLFCWHKEDLDLSAINFLHQGKSKFWYSVPLEQSHILQREAKTFFPQHFSKCSEHLRHKTSLFNPYNLVKKYPNLKITKTEHKPGEFMLVFGGSYHCGFNFGFNIAEAVNYATVGWLGQLVNCKYCHCTKSSVRASFRQILDNLQASPFATVKELQDFKKVVQFSEQRQMEEQAKVDEIKGIRLEFSKKIKKEKKINKINYRGEEYHIDHWATCDKCGQWRKLQKKLKDGKSFHCEQLGKKCNLRDKLQKDYITL